MTPRYGRVPRGQRVFGAAPRNHGPNTTLVAALLNELQVRNGEIARLHATIAALIHAVEHQTALTADTRATSDTPPEAPESPQTNEPAPTGTWAWLRRLWGG